jgi:predicted amidophosphoribosyltransferase
MGGRSSEGPRLRDIEIDSSGHVWHYNKDRSLSEGPETTEKEPSLVGDKAKWGHCNHCEAVIMLSNAKFCSNCGARLQQAHEYVIPMEAKADNHTAVTTEHGEECMVCNLELNEGDDVVWCPHCGNPAHKAHLLEWIRVKSTCPICRKYLSQQFFE